LIFKVEKASSVAEKFFSPSERVSSLPGTILSSVEQVVSAVEKTVSAPEKSVSTVEQSVSAVEKVVLALWTIVSGVEKSVSGDGEIVFLLEKKSFVKRIYAQQESFKICLYVVVRFNRWQVFEVRAKRRRHSQIPVCYAQAA